LDSFFLATAHALADETPEKQTESRCIGSASWVAFAFRFACCESVLSQSVQNDRTDNCPLHVLLTCQTSIEVQAHMLYESNSSNAHLVQLLPPVSRIRDAALAVAARVCIQSSLEGVATQRGAVDAVYGAASGASSSEEAEERKERIQRLHHIIDEWRY
jgi:hypothetical protein